MEYWIEIVLKTMGKELAYQTDNVQRLFKENTALKQELEALNSTLAMAHAKLGRLADDEP